MKIYNTLSRKKEEFKPLDGNKITMYLCGPTVYDAAHLGHGRSAVSFDIARRYLMYKGYEVNFVSNYTDIDDKMINRAKEKNMTVAQLAEKVIPIYEKDYGNLRILTPDHSPRATNYIEGIIEIIKKIEKKEGAYVLDDGVYFDISKFPEYGKLSHQKLEDLKMGARVEVKEEKKQHQDFALWKFEKPGEPAWDSPWGRGRPGWHIECSAMSMNILGETLDIHAGGADLTFPHHECEVAQSELATGKPFVNYWMHNGFVNINEEKMSKSLGNFLILGDLIEKYSGIIIRYFYVQSHYRSPINFPYEILTHAKNGLQRLHDFVRKIQSIKKDGDLNNEVEEAIKESVEKFESSMDDDFETSEGMAAIYEFVKKINKIENLTNADKEKILEFLQKIDTVFAFIIPEEESIDEDIENLIKERDQARENKDWARSDEIRDKLLKKGIILEDSPEGTKWKKA
jgi:cysteinyl-tRNA synthetase